MILSHELFRKYFPEGYQPILVPYLIAEELVDKTCEDMPMSKFKNGELPPMIEIEDTGHLVFARSAVSPKAMFSYVFDLEGKQTVLFCQSYLLTNFRKTFHVFRVKPDSKTPDVSKFTIPISCPEQVFKLGCVDAHRGDANYDEVMRKIFYAPEPKKAKFATKGLSDFKKDAWNPKCKGAMLRAVLGGLYNPDAFITFQKVIHFVNARLRVPNTSFPEGMYRVYETMPDDKIWGVGISCQDAVERLKALSSPAVGDKRPVEDSPDLFAMVDSLVDGQNLLGEVIMDVMRMVCGMNYDAFMEFMEGFEFFEVAPRPAQEPESDNEGGPDCTQGSEGGPVCTQEPAAAAEA